MIEKTSGEKIRALRKEAKLTQKALGKVAGVTASAVTQWESNITKPGVEQTLRMAAYFQVPPSELLSESAAKEIPHQSSEPANYPPGAMPVKKVPLISWVNAGGWCESPDNHAPGDAEEWLDCPFPFSQHAFCLAVTGDSMWPEYREGEYILVDPGVEPLHGNDVVARTPDNKHTFKRLQITPEGTYLLALNPDHPNRKIEAPEGTHICGVVTGSWMNRRRK